MKVDEDQSGFQVVSSRRKPKPSKPILPSSPKKHKTKAKRGKKTIISPLPVSPPIAKLIPGKAIFPEETTAAPLLPTPAQEQFPPLNSAVVEVQPEWTKLHQEISEFEASMLATSDHKLQSRLLLLEKLREIASTNFPGADISLFGSYATRLALPSSDMDVVVLYPFLDSREYVQFAVRTLAEVLGEFPWTVAAQAIDSATVPLVKLQVDAQFFGGADSDLIRVDVSFDGFRGNSATSHIGLDSAKYVSKLVETHSRLRSIVLMLKHLLVINDLNCAYTGGISSYALVIWTAAYLSIDPNPDLGQTLVALLRFYGSLFNPKETGIDLRLGNK